MPLSAVFVAILIVCVCVRIPDKNRQGISQTPWKGTVHAKHRPAQHTREKRDAERNLGTQEPLCSVKTSAFHMVFLGVNKVLK